MRISFSYCRHDFYGYLWRARDSAVVRALAFYQFGPVSYSGFDAICRLSLLLVLSFAPRGVFSGYSGFPRSSKTNISKFQFDQESGRRRTTLWMCYLQIIIYLFIHAVSMCNQILTREIRE